MSGTLVPKHTRGFQVSTGLISRPAFLSSGSLARVPVTAVSGSPPIWSRMVPCRSGIPTESLPLSSCGQQVTSTNQIQGDMKEMPSPDKKGYQATSERAAVTKLPLTRGLVDTGVYRSSSEGQTSKIKGLSDLAPGEAGLPAARMAIFLLGPQQAGREGALWGLFHKGTALFLEAPLPWPSHLPVPHLLTPSSWGLVSTSEFGETQPSVCGCVCVHSTEKAVWCLFFPVSHTRCLQCKRIRLLLNVNKVTHIIY